MCHVAQSKGQDKGQDHVLPLQSQHELVNKQQQGEVANQDDNVSIT